MSAAPDALALQRARLHRIAVEEADPHDDPETEETEQP